jgi:hypothetical protein
MRIITRCALGLTLLYLVCLGMYVGVVRQTDYSGEVVNIESMPTANGKVPVQLPLKVAKSAETDMKHISWLIAVAVALGVFTFVLDRQSRRGNYATQPPPAN